MLNVTKIQIKTNGELPITGTSLAAGYDLITISDPIIVGELGNLPDTYKHIDYIQYHTGIYISPNSAIHTLIMPRSSISKYNLILANGIGLIDSDYRGELMLRFKYIVQPNDWIHGYTKEAISDGGTEFEYVPTGELFVKVNLNKIYKKGDKIGQLVGAVTLNIEFEKVDELDATIRGEGGFGSTTNKLSELTPSINKSDILVVSKETVQVIHDSIEKSHSHIKTDNQLPLPPRSNSNLVDQYQKHGGVIGHPKPYEELVRESQK